MDMLNSLSVYGWSTLTCFPGQEEGAYSRGRKPERWPTGPVPVMDPALWRKLGTEGALVFHLLDEVNSTNHAGLIRDSRNVKYQMQMSLFSCVALMGKGLKPQEVN